MKSHQPTVLRNESELTKMDKPSLEKTYSKSPESTGGPHPNDEFDGDSPELLREAGRIFRRAAEVVGTLNGANPLGVQYYLGMSCAGFVTKVAQIVTRSAENGVQFLRGERLTVYDHDIQYLGEKLKGMMKFLIQTPDQELALSRALFGERLVLNPIYHEDDNPATPKNLYQRDWYQQLGQERYSPISGGGQDLKPPDVVVPEINQRERWLR